MKPLASLFLFFLSVVATSAADGAPAKLILRKVYICENGQLFLDASSEILWSGDQPLQIEGWKAGDSPMVIGPNIEVFDEKGVKIVPGILTTGPAPAFLTKTFLRKDVQQSFPLLDDRGYLIDHTGNYSAGGSLRGTLSDGKSVLIIFPRISFRVVVVPKK